MNKYSFAVAHASASFIGILRLFFCHPGFALRIFFARFGFFLSRKYAGKLVTPESFRIATPDALISYWSMFVEQELYDARWVEPLRKAQHPLILDVGANAGAFSHFVHCLNPTVEVIAFEPLPVMVGRLKELKQQTGINLTCHAKAVSRTVGEVFFESPHGYDGVSHISNSNVPNASNFKVPTTTLDATLGDRKVDLMKIDVEGFECDVLLGGTNTVANTRYIIAEALTTGHFDKIVQVLGPAWHSRKLGSSDYLFFRN